MSEVAAPRRRRLASTAARTTVFDAHEPLLDAIAAEPSDESPWSVYADLLQTEGHPRGELMSLMIERERRPSPRLYDLQRRQLAMHAGLVMPTAGVEVLAWRRGFVSEIRLTTPEQLAAVHRDRSLRLVEAATIVVETKTWNEWRSALEATRLPWRRLRVEASGKIELAPLLACCSVLEALRIVFPANRPGSLIFDDARGSCLKLLALVNAGEIDSLDDVDLPALAELRLMGATGPTDELRTSLRWNRLERAIVADDVEEATDATTALVVVGAAVDAELLRRIAARLSLSNLSARIAPVRWQPRPLTVIQFYGDASAELLPYGIAIALGNVLDPAPPIALVEIEEGRAARYLVLGSSPVRGNVQGRPDATVQRALDCALGIDVGAGILDDLRDELVAAPIEDLIGAGVDQLTMIDPSTAPLVVAEEEPEDEYDDDEDHDEDHDGEMDWGDDEAACYEEPRLPLEPEHDELGIEVMVASPDEEDALAAPPEHVERWFEFREHWDDRAVDIDEEVGETRWPDPERVAIDDQLPFERQVAEPACPHHGCALDDCSGCGALHCVECGQEDFCRACAVTIALSSRDASDDLGAEHIARTHGAR